MCKTLLPVSGRKREENRRVSAGLDLFSLSGSQEGRNLPAAPVSPKTKARPNLSAKYPLISLPKILPLGELFTSTQHTSPAVSQKQTSPALFPSHLSSCISNTQGIYPGVQPYWFFLFALQDLVLKDGIIKWMLIIETKQN